MKKIKFQPKLTRGHEGTKKFKIYSSGFKLFFVNFVAPCDNKVMV
jgi:hypothetical protein